MTNKSGLSHETLMYSIHPVTELVVTHHLPWEKGHPQLEHYEKKGFTYEKPPEKVAVVEVPTLAPIEASTVIEQAQKVKHAGGRPRKVKA